MRLIDFGAIIGFLSGSYALLSVRPATRPENTRKAGIVFGSCALALLWVYLTLEVNSMLHTYMDGLRPGGVSILWSLFGLVLILQGIRKKLRPLRYLGLGLFAIVAWKVFFFDLAQLDSFYRIIAFILLGILALCGSFLYLKYRDTFVCDQSTSKPLDDPPEREPGRVQERPETDQKQEDHA